MGDTTLTNALRTVITTLANGVVPTAQQLYTEGITRIGNNTRWAAARLRALYAESITFTANATTDTLTSAEHALENGTPVRVASTVTLPAGLSSGTTYYVVNKAEDTFQLSATLGGAAIDITDAGTGTHAFTVRGAGMLEGNNVWTGSQTATTLGVSTLFAISGRSTHRASVVVPDASTTIDTSQGDTFILTDPTGARVLTLRQSTSPVPAQGERIRILCKNTGGGGTWTINREGGVTVITFAAAASHQTAEVELSNGNVWRLVQYSSTAAADVTPGAGA